jgi:predicted RNA-binding Zn-ribbon protein involved in translation (DUF1610 family)
MTAKKQEAPQEVEQTPEATDVATTEEVVAEATTGPQATEDGPEVVGAIEDPAEFNIEPANICVECGSVWTPDKGVVSCPACGGKTVSGFKHQRNSLVAADDARFTGDTAKETPDAE